MQVLLVRHAYVLVERAEHERQPPHLTMELRPEPARDSMVTALVFITLLRPSEDCGPVSSRVWAAKPALHCLALCRALVVISEPCMGTESKPLPNS
jgi:hypothetical protein